jgi:hypothetical protein
MFGGPLARMVGPRAGFVEEVELRVRSKEPAYLGARLGRRQPKGNFAHHLVAFITPSQGFAAERDQRERR